MKRIFAVALISLLGVSLHSERIQDKLIKLGIAVAKEKFDSVDFELDDVNGGIKKLSSYRGKLVFLNFWATWCGPCRYEMPSMQRIYHELKSEGFEIVAVNLREGKQLVKKFLDQNKLTFPVLLDKDGRVGAIYGARSIPTTYLIDRNGSIIGRAIGAREWDTKEIKVVFKEILENGFSYVKSSF
jgi:thiol-disulfide isomerase/thioredoxin